jgi:hypothetical protein
MLYIDDKARGVHEGYLVTPITKFELVFGMNIAGSIKAVLWPASASLLSGRSWPASESSFIPGRAGASLPHRGILHRLQRHDVSDDGARRRSAGAARHVRRSQHAAPLSLGRHVSHCGFSALAPAPSLSLTPSPIASTGSKPYCSKTAALLPFNTTCCFLVCLRHRHTADRHAALQANAVN